MREMLLSVTILALIAGDGGVAAGNEIVFGGVCDASAAWPMDKEQRRIVVAEDEHDELLVYPVTGGSIDGTVEVEAALRQQEPEKEADFEAVAALDDRLYWITGHGRNNEGEAKPDRRRVLAMPMALQTQGTSTAGLTDALRARGFEAAIGPDDAVREDLAAEAGGLNIEALAAAPPGAGGLLVGLRNPLSTGGEAIVVPFTNPAAAVDAGQAPELGEPVFLDLGGRGLRDMVWSTAHGAMLLLAGATDNADRFALFTWSGQPTDVPRLVTELGGGMRPEAIVAWDGSRRVLLLSDDGDRPLPATSAECPKKYFAADACPCKRLKGAAAARKEFRGRWLDVP